MVITDIQDGLFKVERYGAGPQGAERWVEAALIGPQEIGTLVLVHVKSAIQVLDETSAQQINDALEALQAVMAGADPTATVDRLFADLTARAPELPAHLRS